MLICKLILRWCLLRLNLVVGRVAELGFSQFGALQQVWAAVLFHAGSLWMLLRSCEHVFMLGAIVICCPGSRGPVQSIGTACFKCGMLRSHTRFTCEASSVYSE